MIPEKEMEEDDTEERNVVIRGNYCKKCHFITVRLLRFVLCSDVVFVRIHRERGGGEGFFFFPFLFLFWFCFINLIYFY